MNLSFYEFLLESQSIRYAVFDGKGRLEFTSPQFGLSLSRKDDVGLAVVTVFPELLGMMEVVEDAMERGKSVEIENIVRFDSLDGKDYISLQILPFQKKILIIVRDTTDRAKIEQRLMQQRNELSLLTAELEKTKKRLFNISTRFLPTQVFDSLISDRRKSPRISGELRDVTILFADIRGFTKWSEKRSPEDIFDLINSFLTKVIDIVVSYNGTLDKFMGDGFLVIFNAPHNQPDHIQRAIGCAQEISRIENNGLRFGIGVHSGKAMAGNIGNAQLMNYTVLGAVVNIAKRLEEFAQAGEVLLSETSACVTEYADQIEYLSDLKIDKRLAPVPVYRLKNQ